MYRNALLLALFLVLTPALSGAEEPAAAERYLQAVNELQKKPLGEQVDGWKLFLEKNPDTPFRSEIETNLKSLEDLLRKTDPARAKDERDTQRYLRAVEFSRKLTSADKIGLWEQFLEENPDSIYRPEVEKKLRELRAVLPGAPLPGGAAATPPPSKIPVVSKQPPKDPQKALLLATFPGLVVPGIGHWYTKDYLLASLLTGVRVGGIAVGIPGIVKDNAAMTVVGAVLYGFSYFVDVADASFSADRFNDAAEANEKTSYLGSFPENAPLVSFGVTVPF